MVSDNQPLPLNQRHDPFPSEPLYNAEDTLNSESKVVLRNGGKTIIY